MAQTINILGFPHAYDLSAPTASPIVLVFVHGWLLSRHYWQPVIQQLADEYQCLSYDLRGFGASQADPRGIVSQRPFLESSIPETVTPEPAISVVGSRVVLSADARLVNATDAIAATSAYAPAAYGQDLVWLLKEFNLTRTWIIGHSLGGSIALWAADQAPQTIEGVICVNSGGGIYLKEEFERFRAAGQQLVKWRPAWLAYLPLLDLALTRLNVANPIERQWGRQRLLDLITAQPEAALGALLDSTTEAEVHLLPQIVARLRQPIHFIAGANDTVMEPKYVHHLASFHPSFECCGNNVTEIPDCGHLAMVEQPEAIALEIRRLLTENVRNA